MLEEAIPSFLACIHSWFTPTVLFVLLNVIIGTIAVTSKASRSEDDPVLPAAANENISAKLSRSSTAILHRIRSFNLHLHSPTNKPLDPSSPLPPSLQTDLNKPDPTPKDLATSEIDLILSRSQSAAEIEAKFVERIKKSASEKPAYAHFQEGEILQLADSIVGEEGREVNARADDFIQRFRQQLKLQRLESLVRYKAMLSGGQ